MTTRFSSARNLLAAGVAAWASALALTAQQPTAAPVSYAASGELIKPADFREWVFLGAGLGMTYNQPASTPTAAARPPSFTNVYVNPASYRKFMQTGA